MKKLLSVALAGSILALAGCGGESSSSSYTGNKTLVNGNKYTCSSESAMNMCKDDDSCKASCNLTYQAVKPVDENTGSCKVENNVVYGEIGDTCSVELDVINGGKKTGITCTNDGALKFAGGSTIKAGSININNYEITCK